MCLKEALSTPATGRPPLARHFYTVGNMSYNKVGGFKFGGSPRIDAKPDGVNVLLAALCEAAYSIDIAASDEQWADAKVELEDLVTEYLSKEEAALNAVVSFGGISYRTSGDYGVRSLFTVNNDAIADIEEYGYTVVYGAIVAIAKNGETTVNENAGALTVGMDEGKVALATGIGKVIATDNAAFKHLTEDNVSFAATLSFAGDGTQSAYYATTLIYRGFTAVIDGDGNAVVVYDDVAPESLTEISLISVHEYAVTNDAEISPSLCEWLSAVLPTEE